MIPGTNITSTNCHLFSFGLKDVWRRGQDATVAPPQQCDVALCELENVVHFSSKACISCAPLLSHTTTHSSSPSASIYSWWLPPGGSSHQQGRTGGLSAGQRINNLGPSARRINNPVAVARIINPAHSTAVDNAANPALTIPWTILAVGRRQQSHSITRIVQQKIGAALHCENDRDQPLALLREGNHLLQAAILWKIHSTTGHLCWTGIDLNLFTPQLPS